MRTQKPEGYSILLRALGHLRNTKPEGYPTDATTVHITFNKRKYSQEVYDMACTLFVLELFIQEWSDELKDQ